MNTDFSDLSIMQMSDSFFPTGLYTMSNGLETLFDEKQIQTVDQIEELITTIISYQLGPADCVALSNSYDFAKSNDVDKVIQCDKMLYSMKLVKESRDCSSILGIEKEKAAMMLLYGFTVSTISAALRLGLIDHIQSQQILHNLKPHIINTIEKFMSTSIENMWQFAPEYDLVQMTHEQKFSKMFIT